MVEKKLICKHFSADGRILCIVRARVVGGGDGGSMSIQLTIISEMEKIAVHYEKKLAPLSADTVLLNSGLDSLCFAVLVLRLEQKLGVDPFSASEDVGFPVTLGDFVRVYENAPK
jgi:acyl carrier protein